MSFATNLASSKDLDSIIIVLIKSKSKTQLSLGGVEFVSNQIMYFFHLYLSIVSSMTFCSSGVILKNL